MKTLKLDHKLLELVRSGAKTSTWRLFDDKDLSAGDIVELIDKVDPARPETWQPIGTAHLYSVVEKALSAITASEMAEHMYASTDEMVTTFQKYYGSDVTNATTVKILYFSFNPY